MGNGKSVNYPKPSNSIAVLKRALESTRARISALETEVRALEAEAADYERSIQRLEASDGVELLNDEAAAEIIARQERAVESDEDYPAERFRKMPRIEIAIALARNFGGYLATGALRKLLSKPGVMKNTKNLFSLASRIPANSDEFVRVWAGLYRLKDHKSAFAEFAEQELMPEAERDPDDPMGEEAVNVAE
jgi:hypothetical protein